MRRLLVFSLLVVAIVDLTPWALYGIGLDNTTGRPIPQSHSSPTSAGETHRGADQPSMKVKPISPWGYIITIASTDSGVFDEGTKAAWLVARNYNLSHLKKRQALWWHLSGAALTIWLTRNWTSEEILYAAAANSMHVGARKQATEGAVADP
jgi:hypothetical protein